MLKTIDIIMILVMVSAAAVTYRIKADSEEIHAMNRELVRLVVETMGAFPRGLVFSFVKEHQVEFRAAA